LFKRNRCRKDSQKVMSMLTKMRLDILYPQLRRVMGERSFAAAAAHAPGGHAGGMKLWKLLSFFVAVPGVAVCWVNAQLTEKEEHEAFERPEFVAYDHLRRRTKKFPWGDGNHSLFHNAHVNALPEGYEEGEEGEGGHH